MNSGSFIGLLAAKCARSVIIFEYNQHFCAALRKYAEANQLHNVRFGRDGEYVNENVSCQFWEFFLNQLNIASLKTSFCLQISYIVSEPFFFSSLLPWDNLRVFYLGQELRYNMNRSEGLVPIIPGVSYFFLRLANA